MGTAKISVIVPVYKVEKELSRCVQSILQQSYHNIEIILVDDGSPDHCPEMCDGYAAEDRRVHVIHKVNGGLSDARNAGLRKASGKYVMYVDSDDYIEKDACERLLDGMQPGVDFVVGALKEIRGNKILLQKHTNLMEGIVYSARTFVIESIKNNEWYAPACLNLYDRMFLINNRLFYKVGYYFEDIEMLPRLFLAAKKVVYINYPFYNYVIRENSIMTSEFTEEKKSIGIAIYSEWMETLDKVQDKEYQRYLYGILTRYYITNARQMDICGWKVKKLDFAFAWKHALNSRERLKIMLFNFFPRLYKRLK